MSPSKQAPTKALDKSLPPLSLVSTPSSTSAGAMPGESASASASASAPAPPPPARKMQKRLRNPIRREEAQPELERLNSLPWSASLPETDPFAFLDGTGEGGFLTLEEIDEAEYGIVGGDGVDGLKVSKKRKVEGKLEEDESCVSEAGEEQKKAKNDKRKKKLKKKKKKDKKRNALKKKGKEVEKEEKEGIEEKVEETAEGNDEEGSDNNNDGAAAEEEIALEEIEFYAWNELRLHHLLMKSIHRLGFKEPTPIQKACIPAAAHQGKDVIGAAETGSGKTLAFALPILQRLLEEREKSSRLLEKGKAGEGIHQGSSLRALIVTPTRELALQVSDHLKEAAKLTNIQVVPIVGGMSTEKQERLLKRMPEIIVGTPGRLWELMSGGEQHLVELQCLSFFVLDEADRMIENGHFQELQSIIDMLPTDAAHPDSQLSGNCKTVPNVQLKKRQTCVFSATIALSDSFRKKLKHRALNPKSGTINGLSSIEKLSERAGIKANVAIVDLTKASIVAEKLEESFIECTEENKEAYLYYILSVHGHGRTIVFCTSIAALRRMASLLHILGINACTLHAQMQQRARLKAIDRFRGSDHAILVATDVAARGLDIPGVRTVVHFQLPHSAEVYIHRSGRTARASADGCCIALISPSDRAKFFSLCKSLSKENLLQFPLNESYLPEILKRMSLARQIDKLLWKNSQENVKKSWFERNAESLELLIDESDSEEEVVKSQRQKKIGTLQLQKLQQELKVHLAKPLQPKQFSHRFLAGAGVSPLLQQQLEELSKQNREEIILVNERRPKLVVIGQDSVEPLQALRNSGHEVCLNTEKRVEARKVTEHWKRKRRQDKKAEREQRKNKKKMTD